jgi:phosphopantothenoylcysteine synthetase/decarboxylase
MNVLVTAGNTLALIDRVRGITNIFSGRTGASIALEAHARGHSVVLLTSRPDAVTSLGAKPSSLAERWTLIEYRTFDDLHELMRRQVESGSFDGVVHSAAVSDYVSGGIFAPAPGTSFSSEQAAFVAPLQQSPKLVDRAAGKVKSDESELWLRLVRAPKLVDEVRSIWRFRKILVKFKLEVGISDERLLEIAEHSRKQSAAELMVANTLEGATTHAYLGPLDDRYERVARTELATRLLDAIEDLHDGDPPIR